VTQIRENIFLVTDADLGKPTGKGYWKVADLGEVMLDAADERYLAEYRAKGYEPAFFVSRSASLNGAFVVVSRQRV
jgi:hypothetical protein